MDVEGLRSIVVYVQELEYKVQCREIIWVDSVSSFCLGLEMVEILVELYLDIDVFKVVLIYCVVREGQVILGEVSKKVGGNIVKLVEGVLRMVAISVVMNLEKKVVLGQVMDQFDNLCKMLVVMVDDVWVVLIKLVEWICVIRVVKNVLEEKKQKVV